MKKFWLYFFSGLFVMSSFSGLQAKEAALRPLMDAASAVDSATRVAIDYEQESTAMRPSATNFNTGCSPAVIEQSAGAAGWRQVAQAQPTDWYKRGYGDGEEWHKLLSDGQRSETALMEGKINNTCHLIKIYHDAEKVSLYKKGVDDVATARGTVFPWKPAEPRH